MLELFLATTRSSKGEGSITLASTGTTNRVVQIEMINSAGTLVAQGVSTTVLLPGEVHSITLPASTTTFKIEGIEELGEDSYLRIGNGYALTGVTDWENYNLSRIVLRNAYALTSVPNKLFPTCISTREMFFNCYAFNSANINNWNTSNVTDMSYMFYSCRLLQYPDFVKWNTLNVTDMSYMFYDCSVFNWRVHYFNTANVLNMASMFEDAREFNQILSGWNTQKVTNMSRMFSGANVFNSAVNHLQVDNVTNMEGMFRNAKVFNQSILSWNTVSLVNMVSMFDGASVFNRPVSHLNTSKVTDLTRVFAVAAAFNQTIVGWNIAAVTSINLLFNGGKDYNQNLSSMVFKSSTSRTGYDLGPSSWIASYKPKFTG